MSFDLTVPVQTPYWINREMINAEGEHAGLDMVLYDNESLVELFSATKMLTVKADNFNEANIRLVIFNEFVSLRGELEEQEASARIRFDGAKVFMTENKYTNTVNYLLALTITACVSLHQESTRPSDPMEWIPSDFEKASVEELLEIVEDSRSLCDHALSALEERKLAQARRVGRGDLHRRAFAAAERMKGYSLSAVEKAALSKFVATIEAVE